MISSIYSQIIYIYNFYDYVILLFFKETDEFHLNLKILL